MGDAGEIGSEHGQAALGVLIFQDMAVVGMVLLLPALAGQGGGASGVFVALAKAVAIIAVVLVVARRVMPILLQKIARACSPDIFLLSLIAICFGTAYLASIVGLGVSLGAFLAGLVVSESSFSEHALSEILPLRIIFSVAFFVSIGMLLDPRFTVAEPLLVAAIVLVGDSIGIPQDAHAGARASRKKSEILWNRCESCLQAGPAVSSARTVRRRVAVEPSFGVEPRTRVCPGRMLTVV